MIKYIQVITHKVDAEYPTQFELLFTVDWRKTAIPVWLSQDMSSKEVISIFLKFITRLNEER